MEESATEELCSQMGHEGSSQSGRGKNKKHWTAEEDKALVESLLELVDSGTHRGDNGFKLGYLTILEEKMIPRGHTAIKGTPHIASRLKLLKQDYGMYAEMMTSDGLSGFGYNSHIGYIEAPDSVWDSVLQFLCVLQTKSKKFARLRYKAFPNYNDLHVGFGRDRATGNEAMSFADMVQDDANEEAGIGGSPSVPAAGQTRKRKRSSPTNEIASAMKEIGEKITETGMVLSTALQAKHKMDMQRQLTRDIMKIDPKMSIEQEMFLLGKIGKDVDMLNMFSEWDDEKKARFVTSLLNGRVRDPNLNDHYV